MVSILHKGQGSKDWYCAGNQSVTSNPNPRKYSASIIMVKWRFSFPSSLWVRDTRLLTATLLIETFTFTGWKLLCIFWFRTITACLFSMAELVCTQLKGQKEENQIHWSPLVSFFLPQLEYSAIIIRLLAFISGAFVEFLFCHWGHLSWGCAGSWSPKRQPFKELVWRSCYLFGGLENYLGEATLTAWATWKLFGTSVFLLLCHKAADINNRWWEHKGRQRQRTFNTRLNQHSPAWRTSSFQT